MPPARRPAQTKGHWTLPVACSTNAQTQPPLDRRSLSLCLFYFYLLQYWNGTLSVFLTTCTCENDGYLPQDIHAMGLKFGR